MIQGLQISHHTGALSSTSLDQTVVLIAVEIHIRDSHRAKTKTPAFKGRRPTWSRGIRVRAKAIKFAMGTSGYVGSI